MGEQESFSSSNSNPVFIVIMRNSRGKLFVYFAVLGVLCFIVFLLSSTHTSLKELENVNEKCQQQRDSLSAQLQVVYEHKNRLEKSLQQEKTDHRHSKEENEKQFHDIEGKLQEERDKEQKFESQISQLKTKYSELEEEKTQSENALTEQLKTVTAQKDTEIEKLQNHISELLSEKDKLETANNAKTWKLEQHANELTYCKLQHDQTKNDLAKCQEQLQQKFNQNTVDNHLLAQIATLPKKVEGDKVAKVESEHSPVLVQTEIKVTELKDHVDNKSSPLPPTENKVFSKPHILPPNNAADGVLPKPEEDKNEDIDAAVEVPEMKKGDREAKLLHVNERGAEDKINFMPDERKDNGDILLKVDVHKEQENHPQVLPPHNFDIGEKDDHAAERGEYGVQYGMPDARQVEVPVFNAKHNVKRKNFMPIPQHIGNDIAAQMQDMMNKSPGDVNNFEEQNALHIPPQHFRAIDEKIREFKNAGGLLHRGAEGNNGMDDKIYDEDDDDRENDDDQGNGVVPEMKGIHALQDNDFDDQDNQENGDNAKEEGVVVAPK